VREGDAISPYYDPMIAKLIVWGEDRDAALRGMAQALRECEIAGLSTNVDFLGRVVASRAFSSGDLDTGLIERNRADLLPTDIPVPAHALAAAVFMEHMAPAGGAGPWDARDGWRMNLVPGRMLTFKAGEVFHDVRLAYTRPHPQISVGGLSGTVAGQVKGRRVSFAWGEAQVEATVVAEGIRRTVFVDGVRHDMERHDPLLAAGDADDDAAGGHLTAPMSGKVLALLADPGARVEKGAPLMVMEAMKMEHTIAAPAAGMVKAFRFAAGDQVSEGAQLVDFEAAS